MVVFLALIFIIIIAFFVSGYGVIAPATDYGKLITIAYAVIGIPIYLIALAYIGEFLANMFKKVYWFACCCGCCREKRLKLTNMADPNSAEKSVSRNLSEIGVLVVRCFNIGSQKASCLLLLTT